MNDLFNLQDKVAVVTGGTGALGATMCRTLASAGATVVIMARTSDAASALADEINAAGGTADAIACDVLDADALQAAAQIVEARYGRIDILLNGAGGNHPDATAMPGERTFFDLPPDALRWVFDLNLMGTILPSQVFGAMMVKQHSGVIINISSMASMQPLTRVVAYGAAKAAINNFTQWLAVYMATEHSPHIRVNAIAPGFFLGQQNRFLLMNDDDTLTGRGQQIIDHTPQGRFGNPDDLSGTLLWLASDASRFVTGIVVPVDGGFSAYSGV
ncbi:MAG: SDR family NAD(P)-dependent oxidoreductase [Anaerolineaceae bacterium]|nr:MAG: SDR family NAD(P)-dependent oxidoreductase [Anaerolineaceae bacterium]